MSSVLATRNLYILNGCKKLQAYTYHMTTACTGISKTTVDFLVVNAVALGTIAKVKIVDRPVQSRSKNFHSHLLLKLHFQLSQPTLPQATRSIFRWIPGTKELQHQYSTSCLFTDRILQATWTMYTDQDALDHVIEGYLMQ